LPRTPDRRAGANDLAAFIDAPEMKARKDYSFEANDRTNTIANIFSKEASFDEAKFSEAAYPSTQLLIII
jgi:hypothetical protein